MYKHCIAKGADCGGLYGWPIQEPFINPFPLPFSTKETEKLKYTPFQIPLYL